MSGLSNWLKSYRVLPVALALVCGVLLGTAQSFATNSKHESPSPTGQMGKTVFVDVGAFGKKRRAAKEMTKLHEELAQKGWTVVNVAVYAKKGKLEGFFVTYVKK